MISRESLGYCPTYDDAQRVVDAVNDHRFELQTTQIVRSHVHPAEQITCPAWPRVVLFGATGGVWSATFIGLLFSAGEFSHALTFSLFWEVLCGAVLTVISHALMVRRRDCTLPNATISSRFEVLVLAGDADHARSILATAAIGSSTDMS